MALVQLGRVHEGVVDGRRLSDVRLAFLLELNGVDVVNQDEVGGKTCNKMIRF